VLAVTDSERDELYQPGSCAKRLTSRGAALNIIDQNDLLAAISP
jgi:hypothetical protein